MNFKRALLTDSGNDRRSSVSNDENGQVANSNDHLDLDYRRQNTSTTYPLSSLTRKRYRVVDSTSSDDDPQEVPADRGDGDYTCINCGAISFFEDSMEQRCECFEIVDRSLRSAIVNVLNPDDKVNFKLGYPYFMDITNDGKRIDYFGGPTTKFGLARHYTTDNAEYSHPFMFGGITSNTNTNTNMIDKWAIPGNTLRKNIAIQKLYDDFITPKILRRHFLMDLDGAIACITAIHQTILPKIFSELVRLVFYLGVEYQLDPSILTSGDVLRASTCLQDSMIGAIDQWAVDIVSALEPYASYAAYAVADHEYPSSSESDDSDYQSSIDFGREDRDRDDDCDPPENVPGFCIQFTDVHDDITDDTGIELTAKEKCQFEKCYGLYPCLFMEELEYYSLTVKTSFFYPCAMFQQTRHVLSLVLSKVRYLRAVDVYHWDLFVGMLRLRLADSVTMVVFQQRDTVYAIREFLLPVVVRR